MLTFQGKKIDLQKTGDKEDIDKLMHISGSLIEEWRKIEKRAKNGFTLVEIMATAWSLKDEVSFTMDNLNELKREIIGLDENETAQLVTFLMGAFGMSRLEAYDAINNIVIKSISIAYDIAAIVKNIKKLK
jgi:hypothetical protein